MHRHSDIRNACRPPRRWTTAAGAALLLGILSACAPTEPADGALLNSDGSAVYTDGTYVASFSHTGPDGWQPYVELHVRAGLIEKVCSGALGRDGTRLAASELYGERFRMATGVTAVTFLDELERALLARQELPIQLPVNALDGRISWAGTFVTLADAALAQAHSGDTTPVQVPTAGSYVELDAEDELGWDARMAVAFAEAGPAALSFQERRTELSGVVRVKSTDPVFIESYERVMGIVPADVVARLSAGVLQSEPPENAEEADAVSGATGTIDRFRLLLDRILASRVSVPLPARLCSD